MVLFTDVVDERASQALIAHTARGAVRHLPLVVALRNDALLAAARPEPHASADSIYESAAAEELVQARETALQRMRRAGVSVVDVSPTPHGCRGRQSIPRTQKPRSRVEGATGFRFSGGQGGRVPVRGGQVKGTNGERKTGAQGVR